MFLKRRNETDACCQYQTGLQSRHFERNHYSFLSFRVLVYWSTGSPLVIKLMDIIDFRKSMRMDQQCVDVFWNWWLIQGMSTYCNNKESSIVLICVSLPGWHYPRLFLFDSSSCTLLEHLVIQVHQHHFMCHYKGIQQRRLYTSDEGSRWWYCLSLAAA